MGVTFNLVDQGTTRTGVYCHMVEVSGPQKNSDIADGTDGRWYVTYGVIQREIATRRDGLTGFRHGTLTDSNGQRQIWTPIQQWRFCMLI